MNALQTFHQAHKERVARIEAAAHRAKAGKLPAPAPTFEAPPVSDMSSLFGEAWSLLEGNGRQGQPPVSVIQRVVAKHYCVSRLDLLSQRRTANVVRPRQVAMYLAKTLTARSLPDIGARFGGRDHTTALHAFRKIERLIETDEVLAAQVSEIRNEIEGL